MPLYSHSGCGGAERASCFGVCLFACSPSAGLETEPLPRVRVKQPGAVLSVGSGVTAQALAMNERAEDCFGDSPACPLHE